MDRWFSVVILALLGLNIWLKRNGLFWPSIACLALILALSAVSLWRMKKRRDNWID
jgi:hypothetical protein